MLTLLEVLNRTETFFRKAGLERPRLDAELILAHALDCPRLQLYLQHDRPMEESDLQRIRPLVKQRSNRIPLQHVLGSTGFFGLDLKVDARALIPRQETEQLVELVLERCKQHPPSKLLDLGTGTGAIALALATELPEVDIVATDASADALALARENAEAHHLDKRVSLRQGNWYEPLQPGERFDWIVSNPPYLTESEWREAAPEVREHDPRAALVAENDGLADLELILRGASRHLVPGGGVALETGIAQHEALGRIAVDAGLERVESLKDYGDHPRFFIARAPI